MRDSALAALGAVLVAACTQLPVEPSGSGPDAAVSAAAPKPVMVGEERRGQLSAALMDARTRLLPTLHRRDALEGALTALDEAVEGGQAATMTAAATAAVAALDDAAAANDPEVMAELDAIRLMLDEVLASAAKQ